MPNNTVRERPYRPRPRVREERRADTSATALTAQIIICVMLVVCAFAAKTFYPDGYAPVRERYAAMLSDPGETDKALEWFSGGGRALGEALDALKGYVTGLLPGKTDEPPAKDGEAEIDIDEPEDEPEPLKKRPDIPAYDYLGEHVAEVTKSSGGMFPWERDATEQSPPEGSTFAPVYLSAAAKPPITGPVTSEFSYRDHPLTGESDFHTGLDVAAEEGRPVLAALPGEVEETGWSDIYGNYIVIKHSESLKTSYAHCSEIIAGEGMKVRQGERIALVGETGVTTGPHLHFSVIVDGKFTDPLWVLSDNIRVTE